ncbi:hypothetical protein, partial [Salmonella enterica]|uniref:hypothetical protein n=1 Tax=Salmonella enterica TaxID=28901 RepID=UPI003D28B39E
KIGPDPRNFNQRVNLGRNDLLIRTFLSAIGINLFILHWNGEPINGLSSIIISLIYFFVLALILSGFVGSFVWLGLWIYSRFRTLNLHIFPANRQS